MEIYGVFTALLWLYSCGISGFNEVVKCSGEAEEEQ